MRLLLVSVMRILSHTIFKAALLLFCLLVFVFWQVGSDFGYFPKDLLEINHNYSNEELELPTDVSLICYFLIGLLYWFLPWH